MRIISKVSKVYLVTNEEFINLIKQSKNHSDVLRALGLSTTGGSSRDVYNKRLKELNCDTSHFKGSNGGYFKGQPLEEILIENSTYQNLTRLKIRLINEGKLEYKCNECGIDSWRDKPISLQLEHKNGINNDHRLENICLLCPNCHSQTDTFAGRNKNNFRGFV